MVFGTDEFEQPATRIGTTELAQKADDRNQCRPLLFLVQLLAILFELIVEERLIFDIHLAHRRRHQIAN
jgi:hypothetical protein